MRRTKKTEWVIAAIGTGIGSLVLLNRQKQPDTGPLSPGPVTNPNLSLFEIAMPIGFAYSLYKLL